jgi:predicted glycosyltransferase
MDKQTLKLYPGDLVIMNHNLIHAAKWIKNQKSRNVLQIAGIANKELLTYISNNMCIFTPTENKLHTYYDNVLLHGFYDYIRDFSKYFTYNHVIRNKLLYFSNINSTKAFIGYSSRPVFEGNCEGKLKKYSETVDNIEWTD